MNLPDIPLFAMLRERMSWLNQRQGVLSQNVANADTPGYGARDLKAGAVDTLFEIGRDKRLNHRFPIESGVLAAESSARLGAFFAKLRAAGEK